MKKLLARLRDGPDDDLIKWFYGLDHNRSEELRRIVRVGLRVESEPSLEDRLDEVIKKSIGEALSNVQFTKGKPTELEVDRSNEEDPLLGGLLDNQLAQFKQTQEKL